MSSLSLARYTWRENFDSFLCVHLRRPVVLREVLPDFGLDNLLNRGDIAVLGDSYWSRGLVLRGQLVEKDLIEVFVLS
jgi:hypothetical protein